MFLVQLPLVTAYDVCINASMILLILPIVVMGSRASDQFYEDDGSVRIKIYFGFIIAAVVLTVLVRIILSNGISI